MSKPKHTPGPWFIDPMDPHRIGTPVKDSISGTIYYSHLAQVFLKYDAVRMGNMPKKNEIGEANAKLIAAAPDLLEALKNSNIEMAVTLEAAMGISSLNRDMLRARIDANRAVIENALYKI